MTHVGNLESILKEGRLYCDARAPRCNPRSIAYGRLKAMRAVKPVPVSPGGFVSDYVPFYFAPRSPMLFAIYTGWVRSGLSQDEVIYLVTSVEKVVQANKLFVFTDRNATALNARFSSDLSQLNQYVNWDIMRSPFWFNRLPDYPDRKSRRQAEFLVYQELEWELIEQIGVYDSTRLNTVQQLLQNAAHQPLVSVERGWYY